MTVEAAAVPEHVAEHRRELRRMSDAELWRYHLMPALAAIDDMDAAVEIGLRWDAMAKFKAGKL